MTIRKVISALIIIGFTGGLLFVQAAGGDTKSVLNDAIQKMKAGKLKEAEALFIKVIEADDQNILAHMNLGILYIKAKKLPEAERALYTAAKLGVEEAQPHIILGKFYLQMGDKAKAARALRRGFEIDPDSSECASLAPHLGWQRAGNQWLSAEEIKLLEKAPDTAFGFSAGEQRNYTHHYDAGRFHDWECKQSIKYSGKRICQGQVAYRFLGVLDYMSNKRTGSMTPGSRTTGGKTYIKHNVNAILDVTPQGFPLHYEGQTGSKVEHLEYSGYFCYDFTPEGVSYTDHTNNVKAGVPDNRYIRDISLEEFDQVNMANWYLWKLTKQDVAGYFKKGNDFYLDHLTLLRNIPLYLFLQSGKEKMKFGQAKVVFPNTGENTFQIPRDLAEIVVRFVNFDAGADGGEDGATESISVSFLMTFLPNLCSMRDFEFSRTQDQVKVHDKKIDCYKVQTDFYNRVDFWVLENGKIIKLRYPDSDETLWIDEEHL